MRSIPPRNPGSAASRHDAAASYAQGDSYCYGRAFTDAATAIVGADLAAALTADLLTFNDGGLDSIGTERRARLVARYSGFAHPAAAGRRLAERWLCHQRRSGADPVAAAIDKTRHIGYSISMT